MSKEQLLSDVLIGDVLVSLTCSPPHKFNGVWEGMCISLHFAAVDASSLRQSTTRNDNRWKNAHVLFYSSNDLEKGQACLF